MKIKFLRMAVLFPAAAMLLASCGSNPKPGEIVARVGDAYLTRDMVLSLTPETLEREDREFFIHRIVEQWVDNQTLARKAAQEGMELSPREIWQIRNLDADMLASKFLDSKMRASFPVAEGEIEEYYTANPGQFKRKMDEVHLVHLYFEQLDNTIVNEIRQSKSLPEVIKKNYLDRQVNRIVEPNGDLGYVPVEQLREKFKQAIRGAQSGGIYGPIRTEDGYHFLQVLDRQPAGSLKTLELVHDEIATRLQIARRQEAIKMLKEKIRQEFDAETHYENIL